MPKKDIDKKDMAASIRAAFGRLIEIAKDKSNSSVEANESSGDGNSLNEVSYRAALRDNKTTNARKGSLLANPDKHLQAEQNRCSSLKTGFEGLQDLILEKVRVRKSCYLVEEVQNFDGSIDFFCDCWLGMKGKHCKHQVAILMKTDILPIDDSVRSRPLGQKRGRGKPRKVPGALVKSP